MWNLGLDTSKVRYAVSCGQDMDEQDEIGVKWSADKDYVGGQTTCGCGNHRWYMPSTKVYHCERWGENFSYNIPFPEEQNSHYTLVLKFSECYFWEPGMKVFDVKIGDTTVL